ncbi:heavy metal translocating P-type ATPase [Xylariaceae sp. FL0594]|nr:heavy metal translocating P-type ATPase [Xylariaceae sp. FL0594]
MASKAGVTRADIYYTASQEESPRQHNMPSDNSPDDSISVLQKMLRFIRAQYGSERKGRTARKEACEECQKTLGLASVSRAGETWDRAGDRLGVTTIRRDSAFALDTPVPLTGVVSDDEDVSALWKASFAIQGMTCASCSKTLTQALEAKDWITMVAVNLLSHSAVVEFKGPRKAVDDVVETIEESGFGAAWNDLEPVGKEVEEEKEESRERTVQIRIDGLCCLRCGDRVTSNVARLHHDLRIDSRPTFEKPIMTVTYVPQAPTFTIRQILAEVEATDPSFKAYIYRPPTLEEAGHRAEGQYRREILRRVVLTFFIVVPTFIIGIVYMSLVPEHDPVRMHLMEPLVSGINRSQFILLGLATPVYFYTANNFHKKALKEMWSLWRPRSRTPLLRRFYRFGSMNTLISLGTSVAYLASVAQLIASGVRHLPMIADKDLYFDSVVFLTFFLLIGRYLEAYSQSKIRSALDALAKLRPTTAILAKSDDSPGDEVVETNLLEVGDIVRVPFGASPPCDGEVLQGNTKFDESSLTGESRTVKKTVGDRVYSGTVNQGTPVLMRVTGVEGTSMLDKILEVVREGQTKPAPVEKRADTIVGYFVPVITFIAVLTWVVWFIIASTNRALGVMEPAVFSLQFAIAVFVVACPCGLGLAGPTAIYVGGSLAARFGIIVKGGGEAFETASRVDCVVFDKTGTLTEGGEPIITDTEYLDQHSEESRGRLIGALWAVEENSTHPVAKAIVRYCKAIESAPVTVNEPEEIPGRGLRATCTGETADENSFDIVVGNEALMQESGVFISSAVKTLLQTWRSQAKSVALVATKTHTPPTPDQGETRYTLSAALAISDPIREEAPAVVRALRTSGRDVWMISGDNITTARAVALRVGIDPENVIAEVLPVQKAAKIKHLQGSLKPRRRRRIGLFLRRKGEVEEEDGRATVAMVGDGINDAPALSTADVGIAIGSGSDVAIASADFVLVNSSLSSVVTLLQLSAKVFRRIKFNFAWALVYNLVAVPVAAGCFYAIVVDGTTRVALNPVWASLAMALSSISVVLSSLALKLRVPGLGFRPKKGC